MRLANSFDGHVWTDLPGHGFLITPEKGLMRDPFLLLGPDRQFHLIWTTDWESQDIGYACSKDLVNWSEQRRLPVMQTVAGTRNCWAPEMVYDESTQSYVIFWASTVKGLIEDQDGASENDYNHRMWRATTRDFQTFSEPAIFFDPGFNVIDATFHRSYNGKWHLIVKDEQLDPVRKNLFACEAESPLGPFTAPGPAFTGSWVEGPAAIQVSEWTYVYFDQYLEKRYGAVRSRDLKNWEDVSAQVTFPEGARHGSIVTLGREHFKSLFPSEK